MEEIDIWRSAALLVKQHGQHAGAHAVRHKQAMVERSDADGEAVWTRIIAAIAALRTHAPDSPDRVN